MAPTLGKVEKSPAKKGDGGGDSKDEKPPVEENGNAAAASSEEGASKAAADAHEVKAEASSEVKGASEKAESSPSDDKPEKSSDAAADAAAAKDDAKAEPDGEAAPAAPPAADAAKGTAAKSEDEGGASAPPTYAESTAARAAGEDGAADPAAKGDAPTAASDPKLKAVTAAIDGAAPSPGSAEVAKAASVLASVAKAAAVSDGKPSKEGEQASAKKTPPPGRGCTAEGCTKYIHGTVKRLGGGLYCMVHFKALEKDKGKIEKVLADIKAARSCKADGCDKGKKPKCLGYCQFHFDTLRPDLDIIGEDKGAEDKGSKESGKKRKKSLPCKVDGCDKDRDENDSKHCAKHARLAHMMSAPPLPAKGQAQKNLKPVFKQKTPVYAAYWSPEDEKREEEPQWYPGVVTKYSVSKKEDDKKYGYIRYYNIHYDDGDKMKDIPEHFVMKAEEYLLNMHHSEMNEGNKRFAWKGVRNITDKKTKDGWAKNVGWYEATIDGKKSTFSLLSDALRAYDAAVVRKKWTKTKEGELNLPGDWVEVLFDDKEDGKSKGKSKGKGAKGGKDKGKKGAKKKATTKHMKELEKLWEKNKPPPIVEKEEEPEVEEPAGKKAKGSKGQRKAPPETIMPTSDGLTDIEPANHIGPGWTQQTTKSRRGKPKIEYVSPTGTRFGSVNDAIEYLKQQKEEEERHRPPPQDPAAAAKADPKKEFPKKGLWSPDDIELLIKLDEKFAHLQRSRAFQIMAAKLPQTQDQCSAKVQRLRKLCREGNDIQKVIGMIDIKQTLGKWNKEEIDLLMTLEDRYKDLDEDSKNEMIGKGLPRWDTDKCSFKTLYMRWETRVRREYEAAKAQKEKRDADIKAKMVAAKRKREEVEAAAKAKVVKVKVMPAQGGGVMSSRPNATKDGMLHRDVVVIPPAKKQAVATAAVAAPAKKVAMTPPTKKQAAAKAAVVAPSAKKAAPSSEAKIDDKFVEVLNNDPYLAKGGGGKKGELEDLLSDSKTPDKSEDDVAGALLV